MKKYLLILITAISFAQAPSRFSNVQITGNTVDNTAQWVNVQTESGIIKKILKSSLVPQQFTNIVYVNTTSPSGATIFDLNNPPVTNDNLLKATATNLYIGTDGSTWNFNTLSGNYATYSVPKSSNFNLAGTSIDAGNDKTSAIVRSGKVGVGSLNISGNTTDNLATKILVHSANGDVNEIDKASMSTTKASATLSGTVKTDVTEVDPVVYTKVSTNTIFRKKDIVFDYKKSYIKAFTAGNRRNSEGDVLVLNDGRYLAVYTSFIGTTGTDFDPSNIIAKISNSSDGDSWGSEILVSANIGLRNVISVSLLRIDASTIRCFFLVRNSDTNLSTYQCTSTNEGLSWSNATLLFSDNYGIVLNASVKRGNSSRILIPTTYCSDASAPSPVWSIANYYSDNNGTTYTKSNVVNFPTAQGETSVVYLGGNDVLLSTRSTTSGVQYFTKSTNNGATLGTPYASTLASSASPAQIINYGGVLIALHNPTLVGNTRNPLTISKSLDLGVSWSKISDLENYIDATRASYPSLTLDGDNLLISYFEDKAPQGISLKFSKINIPDLLALVKPETDSPITPVLTSLNLGLNGIVQPTDNVVSGISKLQNQINLIKGAPFNYTGTGEGIVLKNISPDNLLTNLNLTFKNTNGSVQSRLGFLNSTGYFYLLSLSEMAINSPLIRMQGLTYFNDKVGIGTSTPSEKLEVNGNGKFSGTIVASPAINSDQVIVKSQLDLKSNIASPTFTGVVTTPAINVSGQTGATIAGFDPSKNLVSLPTASYPSLAEIATVKGASSNLQNQIDTKATDSNVMHLTGDEIATGLKKFRGTYDIGSTIFSEPSGLTDGIKIEPTQSNPTSSNMLVLSNKKATNNAVNTAIPLTILRDGSVVMTISDFGTITANKLNLQTASNSAVGNATLVAGTKTITTTAATTSSIIMLTKKTNGGTIGTTTYTTASGSFIITSSSATDTSTYSYLIIN